MILYHGSKYKFDKFSANPPVRNKGCVTCMLGTFLVGIDEAKQISYCGDSGYLYKCEINLKHPKIYKSTPTADGFDFLKSEMINTLNLKYAVPPTFKNTIMGGWLHKNYYQFSKINSFSQKLIKDGYDHIIVETSRDSKKTEKEFQSRKELTVTGDSYRTKLWVYIEETLFKKYNYKEFSYELFSKCTPEEKLIFFNKFNMYEDAVGEILEKVIYNPENRINQYIILNPDDIKILSCDPVVSFKMITETKEPIKYEQKNIA